MQFDAIDPRGKKVKLDVTTLVPKNFEITIGYLGPITVAMTNLHDVQGMGFAVCMKGDKYSKDIGAGIASARAIRSIADAMEEKWSERSVTKEEWASKHKKG